MPGKPEASNGADAPEEAASNAAEQKPAAKKRAAHRSRITGLYKLPTETTEVIPDLVAADPESFERCGEEVTELLDITPARFFKRRIVRVKFRRKVQRHLPPVVAPTPATPLVGGLPAAVLLAHLYHIEKDLRETKTGPALRDSERAWRSAPIVARIKATMQTALPKHRPQSPFGKALAYGLRHWDALARHLEDGRFEIDNNLVERPCVRSSSARRTGSSSARRTPGTRPR